MSQHPFSIADQTFPAMLITLNQVAQALASSSSGASEPGTTYPYQLWADTTNNLLKLRNGANNAWMTLAAFDTTNNRWQPRFDVMQVLSSAGLTVKKSDGSAAILALADDGTLDVPTIKQNGTALGAAALKGFTDNDDLSVGPANVGTRGNTAAAIAASAIGVGQTWQSVSRSKDTAYQNTTGKPIQVFIQGDNYYFEVSSDGSTWLKTTGSGNNGYDRPTWAIIPDGIYYRATSNGAGTLSWVEMR